MKFLKYICAASLLAASAGTLWSCDDADDKRLSDAVLASVSSLTFEAQDTSEKIITVYADRSFSFITKTPPAAVLIKKECNIESGSGVPNKEKVATISKASIQKIAEMKMRDLNAASLEAAMSMIAGTARSMGVVVGE